ncbi:hypothetical protein DPMN_055153 [Dreissena polymorpha]|uniref:Uncharacterized protein n=1 Tax=Dreissena polymorpha TaxID=45954 RepID=A0A9D4CR90_DREPO|nr:hypothetical protein DPMN_055153 [Dreissena polymorpha]
MSYLFPDAADDAFSDIMQTKGTNDIFKIPRVQSPIKKPKNDEVVDNQPVDAELNQTVLPKVANKNMTNGLNSATSNSLKPALAASETVEINETDVHLDTSLQHKPGKSSATNAVNESDEPFRPRASTFPGKVQRPNVKVEKTLPHTITIDSGENKTVTSPRSRLYRPHRENIGSSPIPVSRRGSVPNRDHLQSPTHMITGTSSNKVQFRKQSGIHRRIAYVQKSKELQEESHDSIQDELTGGIGKHLLSRKSMTNRFVRLSRNGPNFNRRDNSSVVEHLTDLNHAHTHRPNASLNVTVNNNVRSATPKFPSLTPSIETIKR